MNTREILKEAAKVCNSDAEQMCLWLAGFAAGIMEAQKHTSSAGYVRRDPKWKTELKAAPEAVLGFGEAIEGIDG